MPTTDDVESYYAAHPEQRKPVKTRTLKAAPAPACRAVGRAMLSVTQGFWDNEQPSRIFLFGGCLFWAVAFLAGAIYYAAKMALWLAVMAVLCAALIVALAIDTPDLFARLATR